ncbi:MAG TPA: hypothetical protein VFV92_15760, partial [Candidatus Bathyarchaeia archaeon]|nr:hypothetical protein [Candidatus Bathyarchaeia archaeon]
VEKFVDLIRPYFLGINPSAFTIFARYDFNIADLVLGSGVPNIPAGLGSGWDSGLWDSAIWGAGGQVPQIPVMGASGHGRWCAVGILGASNGQTTLIAYEASLRIAKSFL